MADSPQPGVSQAQWQDHLQESGKMIGANVGARSAIPIEVGFDKVPDMIRVGGKLVDPIHGIGNGKEDEHKTDLLSGFLPGQVVDDEEKEYRIDQHADEFLAGHKFDVSSPVSNDAISHKGQDGPANWWPKQAMARVQPEADQPKAQGRCAQTMKDQEFQGTNCASGQRAEGKNREDQKE